MIRNLSRLLQLMRNSRLSSQQLQDFQWARFRSVLQHACENVPMYRDLYREAGIRPRNIQSLSDLSKIPVIKRPALQKEAPERRVADGLAPGDLCSATTSGSTGRPLVVYGTRDEGRTTQAVHFRALLSMGFKPGDRLAFLGSPGTRTPGLHERLGLFRTEIIHPLQSLEDQLRQVEAFNPTILWFYPTALQALCEYAGRPLGEWLSARKVIASAEILHDSLRRQLTEELGAEIFNGYGATEFGRIAQECPAHEGLHINSDQLLVECVKDGRSVSVGESGSVVVTSLFSHSSPMIRYDLGDIGRLLEHPCSCGSPFPLMGPPEGRMQDLLVLPSGRRFAPIILNYWVNVSSGASHFRIIQHRRDLIEVLFVNDREDESMVVARIRDALEKNFEEPVQIEVRRVDRIPNDGIKFRSFDSRL